MKPKSINWSASSNTTVFVNFNESPPDFKWSIILPGVPTNMSTPLKIEFSWGLGFTPPTIKQVLIDKNLLNKRKLSKICTASSLVGAIIIVLHDFFSYFDLSIVILCNIGNKYAAVFPVPVWATPNISSLSFIKGIILFCIGVGSIKFAWSSAFVICLFKAKSSNVFICPLEIIYRRYYSYINY